MSRLEGAGERLRMAQDDVEGQGLRRTDQRTQAAALMSSMASHGLVGLEDLEDRRYVEVGELRSGLSLAQEAAVDVGVANSRGKGRFRATSRRRVWSQARKTRPIPPRPISSRISYCRTRAPLLGGAPTRACWRVTESTSAPQSATVSNSRPLGMTAE